VLQSWGVIGGQIDCISIDFALETAGQISAGASEGIQDLTGFLAVGDAFLVRPVRWGWLEVANPVCQFHYPNLAGLPPDSLQAVRHSEALVQCVVFRQRAYACSYRRTKRCLDLFIGDAGILDHIVEQRTLHRQILAAVWGHAYVDSTDLLKPTISRLRRKVESDSTDYQVIQTVHGVGYRLVQRAES